MHYIAIPHLQRRLILERHLRKIRQLLDLNDRKMRRMILTACSISLFLYFERASDNGSKLFVVLVYCDFAVILVHKNLCKERKQNRNVI